MSPSALAAGLSLLWLTESIANSDDTEADYQFHVSQALASRVADWESAVAAFATEGGA